MMNPKIGDELTNRFGERCVVKAIHPEYLEIAVHRRPETAYWDIGCWQDELRRAVALCAAPQVENRVADRLADFFDNKHTNWRGNEVAAQIRALIAEWEAPCFDAEERREEAHAHSQFGAVA